MKAAATSILRLRRSQISKDESKFYYGQPSTLGEAKGSMAEGRASERTETSEQESEQESNTKQSRERAQQFPSSHGVNIRPRNEARDHVVMGALVPRVKEKQANSGVPQVKIEQTTYGHHPTFRVRKTV
mmetsp:Transcript_60243/g.71662  ORF Transcript_60243/g.71662 Transcript_60243/m.71662 type:complete len:129 (-) Transcript_60243:432-818(-)